MRQEIWRCGKVRLDNRKLPFGDAKGLNAALLCANSFALFPGVSMTYNSVNTCAAEVEIVADRLRILYVCNPSDSLESLPEALRSSAEVQVVHNPLRALAKIAREEYDGVYVAANHLQNAVRLGRLLENDRILEGMPDAVALLDSDLTILWANHVCLEWCNRGNIVGDQFFTALSTPEVVGPDEHPLLAALRSGHATSALLKNRDNRYFQLHAAPITIPTTVRGIWSSPSAM